MKEQVGNFVIEIDETVTKKEVFHIGDPVKVFEKSYSDKYNVYPGIIVGFAKTDDMAAIEVLYAIVKARFELQAAITLRSAFERNFGKAFKLDQPEETKE